MPEYTVIGNTRLAALLLDCIDYSAWTRRALSAAGPHLLAVLCSQGKPTRLGPVRTDHQLANRGNAHTMKARSRRCLGLSRDPPAS